MATILQNLTILLLLLLASCSTQNVTYDASGVFEAKEIIVSAEVAGRLLEFSIEEGQTLEPGTTVGKIDCKQIELQKEQLLASIGTLHSKTFDPSAQMEVIDQQAKAQKDQMQGLEQQLANLTREQKRVTNLVKVSAAPSKQLDDINGQIEVLQTQLAASKNTLLSLEKQKSAQYANSRQQNRGILSEEEPLQVRIKQLDDQLGRCVIQNPTPGTVLVKYVENFEMVNPGKPLYKLADLSTMTLRAYFTSDQLQKISLQKQVKVLIDQGAKNYKTYSGSVSWIAEEAEFTPKTIQTKEERSNLVYAAKISVPNDGYLRIGMYGEIALE